VGNWNFEHATMVFPPADYRLPWFPAHQQHFIPNLNNRYPAGILSITGSSGKNTESRMLCLGQLRPVTYPFNLEAVQPTGNCADDTQIIDYAKFAGSDDQSDQRPTRDESRPGSPISQPRVQILGKKSFMCIYNKCGSRFTRIPDLKRHHLDKHAHRASFYCRRVIRGFSRKDKRNDHEKRVHC
jgi:hypothetical protein